uniref:hypothetical protein n=1 Tax=Enterocloster clostridioformis TaxID=1531 RepID=UPI001C3E0123|nr:hypothetical protein [Enterocloster clostridioformis]
MRFIEVMVTMEEGGVIRIPDAERERMGLQAGDQVCLSYLAKNGSIKNETKEFLIETM